jgi:hypothetical protein
MTIHRWRAGKCEFCGKGMTVKQGFEPSGPKPWGADDWLEAEKRANEWAPTFAHPHCLSDQPTEGQGQLFDSEA